jgi:prolyl oligopeptidase
VRVYWSIVALSSIVLSLARPVAAADVPPVARMDNVADTYFGIVVHDPYRWMEREDGEFTAWLTAQGAYTRSVLNRIPGRTDLLHALQRLDASNDQVQSAKRCNDRWIYLKAPAGEDIPKLFVRDDTGQEQTIVDPKKFDKDGAHANIDYWEPSWNCKLVAYGISGGGAEIGTLRIVEVDTATDLPDAIDRVYYGGPAWLPNNSGFFYTRLAPNSGANDLSRKILLLHKLGADPDREEPIVGTNVPSAIHVPASRNPWANTDPGSPYVVLGVDAGLSNDDIAAYVVPLDAVSGPKTNWMRVAAESDHVRSLAMHGSEVFLAVVNTDAPKGKVVMTSLESPDISRAPTVVPQGGAAIREIWAGADALYVLKVDGGPNRLARLPWDTQQVQDIPLPPSTGIKPSDFSTIASVPGAVMIAQSWTRSPAVTWYQPSKGALSDSGLQPPLPVDFSDIEVEEVSAPAPDGVAVPLSILHKRGIVLDGNHLTLLDGYGAYGDTRVPVFDRMRRVWFDQGGIYAMAHARGGGEFGESWHTDGMLAKKPNTVSDFIACAEFLLQKGYTSPRLLAGKGRSAGGIMIGGAVATRPDLFGAALITVGMTNALRFEQIPIGPFNTGEFGSAFSDDGFRMLLAIDAYQRVKDGVPYPAILISTGLKDARVSSWQPGKLAARLQAATSSKKPVLLRLDEEGGHSGNGTKTVNEETLADQLSFLLWQAGSTRFQPSR